MSSFTVDSIAFPFLFGGAFIEAHSPAGEQMKPSRFPFLFGGAFIEAEKVLYKLPTGEIFPFLFGGAFIEADLSLTTSRDTTTISLPFRRGFH